MDFEISSVVMENGGPEKLGKIPQGKWMNDFFFFMYNLTG
jgi:hypothetical protein